jgi:hypothetical protein
MRQNTALHVCYMSIENAIVSQLKSVLQQKMLTESIFSCFRCSNYEYALIMYINHIENSTGNSELLRVAVQFFSYNAIITHKLLNHYSISLSAIVHDTNKQHFDFTFLRQLHDMGTTLVNQ